MGRTGLLVLGCLLYIAAVRCDDDRKWYHPTLMEQSESNLGILVILRYSVTIGSKKQFSYNKIDSS